ncbi:MAG: right-handed parallel beta-helix repeat-containing protein [Planctomycetes bacterium]|nr:right-handed parallel beta-helix repeat-containing protein [Planctomycetota bacterium]
MNLRLLCFASALLSGAASAQVSLSGPLSDTSTGPLLAGTVYHASSISVPFGSTLTVQPGAIVKFASFATFTLDGTLVCNGTLASPVIFTDVKDDSAGGDTNGDGPSNGVAGGWTYVRFYAGASASVLDHTEVRYSGAFGWGGLTLSSSTPTFRDCTIRDSFGPGLDLQVSSAPVVERCHFANNGGAAVANVFFDELAGFSQCTASGNAGGDYQAIVGHGVTGDVVVQADDLIGGVGVLLGTPAILAGTTLTFGPGVVLKMKPVGVTWEISGTLNCQGTSAAPVILTDLADDSAGGDTNDDGPSSGTPGHWTYLRFYATASASTLDHTEVRYAGYVGWSGITLTGSTPTLRDCTIRDCAYAALSLEASSTPIVERCAFVDNGGTAVINARFADITGFSQCTASGNVGGNYQAIAGHAVIGDVVVQADNLLGNVAVLTNGLTVGAGNSLTLGAGVILKTAINFVWDFVGGFAAQGTTAQPVVLTTYADDAWGGDTNLDGPSSGVAGGWIGVWLRGSGSATQIEHLLVRYGGANGYPSVTYYAGAGYVLSDVRVEHSATSGFELRDHAGTARGLTAWKCAGTGITLLGGAFDLRQATVVACGTGIVRNAAWTGRVEDSIARQSTTANASGFVVGKWRYSNGDLGLAGVDGNVNVDPLFVDEVGGDFHLNAASPCIDTGDPLSPLDPDLSRADMGAYPFDHWLPVVYCTAKPNSCGLSSSISWTGSMHANANSGFVVSANHAPGTRQGLLLYGNSGPANAPFSGGILCVQAPLKRSLLVTDTVGTLGQCDGVLTIDVATFASGAVGGHPATFLQNAGSGVWCQFWGRDPGQSDPALSNALAFVVQP